VKAQLGQREEALRLLHHAVEPGLNDVDLVVISTEPNFASLDDDSRFTTLAAEAKAKDTSGQASR
jgi:hypothetical protein